MVRMLTRNKIRVIDARVVPRTEDGALIQMSYGGRATFPDELEGALRDASSRHLIDPSRYYFRTTPLFETGAARYAPLFATSTCFKVRSKNCELLQERLACRDLAQA